MSLANKLTLSRTLLGPLFLAGLLVEIRALALLALLCNLFGDLLDGYLARKRKETTKLGELLDSAVDLLFFLFLGLSFSLKGIKEINLFLIPISLLVVNFALPFSFKKEIQIFHTKTKYLHSPLIYLISILMTLGIYPQDLLWMKGLFYLTWLIFTLTCFQPFFESLRFLWRRPKEDKPR